MLNSFGDAAGIARTREEIETHFGIRTAYSGADMSKPADIAQMVEDTRAAFGQIDIHDTAR